MASSARKSTRSGGFVPDSIRASCIVKFSNITPATFDSQVTLPKRPTTDGALVLFHAPSNMTRPWINVLKTDGYWRRSLYDSLRASSSLCVEYPELLKVWLKNVSEYSAGNRLYFWDDTFFTSSGELNLCLHNLRYLGNNVNLELGFHMWPERLGFLRQMKAYVGNVELNNFEATADFYVRRRLFYSGETPRATQLPSPLWPFGYDNVNNIMVWYQRPTDGKIDSPPHHEEDLINEPVYWPTFDSASYLMAVQRFLEAKRRWFPTSDTYESRNNVQIWQAIQNDGTYDSLMFPVANVLFEEPFDVPELHWWKVGPNELAQTMPKLTSIPYADKVQMVRERRRFLGAIKNTREMTGHHPNAPLVYGDVEATWCMILPNQNNEPSFPRWSLINMPLDMPRERVVAFTTSCGEYQIENFFWQKCIVVFTEAPWQNLGGRLCGRPIRYIPLPYSEKDPATPSDIRWGIAFRPASFPSITSTDSLTQAPSWEHLGLKIFLRTVNPYVVDTQRNFNAENAMPNGMYYISLSGNSLGEKSMEFIPDLNNPRDSFRWPMGSSQFRFWKTHKGNIRLCHLPGGQRAEYLTIHFNMDNYADSFIRMANEYANRGFQEDPKGIILEEVSHRGYYRRHTIETKFFSRLHRDDGQRKYGRCFTQLAGNNIAERFQNAVREQIFTGPPCFSKGFARAERDNNANIHMFLTSLREKGQVMHAVQHMRFYFETPFHSPHPLRNGPYAYNLPWQYIAPVVPLAEEVTALEDRLAHPRLIHDIPQLWKRNKYEVLFAFVVDTDFIENVAPMVDVKVPRISPILVALPYRVCSAKGLMIFYTAALVPQGDFSHWRVFDVVVALTEAVGPDPLYYRSPLFPGSYKERWMRIAKIREDRGNVEIDRKIDWAVVPYNGEWMNDQIQWR